jgi:pantetheine-phosphate adenylyltransferase
MIGLFTGSFDPIHPGHIDVIKRASQEVSLLHVVIASSTSKKYLLDSGTRKYLVEMALRCIDNVKVSVSDLSIQEILFYYSPDIFFRGIRNEEDVVYENKMLAMAKMGYPQRWTHKFIETRKEYKNISSSLIKDEIFNANPFMDRAIFDFRHSPKGFLPFWWDICCLAITKSIRFGVVGPIASGKSTFVSQLLNVKFSPKTQAKYIPVKSFSVDKVSRDLFNLDYPSIIRDLDWCCSKLSCKRNYDDFNAARRARKDEIDLMTDIDDHLLPHYSFAHQNFYKSNHGIIIHEWFMPMDFYSPFQGFKFMVLNPSEDVILERLKSRPEHHKYIYEKHMEHVDYNNLKKNHLILNDNASSIQNIVNLLCDYMDFPTI